MSGLFSAPSSQLGGTSSDVISIRQVRHNHIATTEEKIHYTNRGYYSNDDNTIHKAEVHREGGESGSRLMGV